MHTLQDFLIQIKGTEYIIAVVFLIGFIAFWNLVAKTRNPAPQTAPSFAYKPLPFGPNEVRVPMGVFFGRGHAWARPDINGIMRVGVDDLIPKLAGEIDSIEVQSKSIVKRGEPAFSINSIGRRVDIYLPFEGEVKEINTELLKNPAVIHSDPYRTGWIMKIKPSKLSNSLKIMKVAEEAVDWMRNEVTRARDFIANTYPGRPEPASAVLLDGGQMLGGALHKLNEDGWKKFQKEFLTDV